MSKINILGIKIDLANKTKILAKISYFLADGQKHFIITPNPEIILKASDDKEFFKILNQADLAVADGVALKFASWLKGKNLKRFSGADLTRELLSLAERQNRQVAIINWLKGLSAAEEISRAIKNKYPGLSVLAIDADREEAFDFKEINAFAPEIIFCSFGFPYQEKFIYNNLSAWPSVKLGLGVGGSFDFLTGKVKRAPKAMRALGLEWLWRLILKPERWRRIGRAVIIFPLKFLINYFKKYD